MSKTAEQIETVGDLSATLYTHIGHARTAALSLTQLCDTDRVSKLGGTVANAALNIVDGLETCYKVVQHCEHTLMRQIKEQGVSGRK